MHSIDNILEVKDLSIIDIRDGDAIIDKLSFNVPAKKCIAIVGESGSGKSMTVKSIVGLHKAWIKCSGQILFQGENILDKEGKDLCKIRGKEIFMIFQDGMSAFDPTSTIESVFVEILMENGIKTKQEAQAIAIKSLENVNIKRPADMLKKYPHQLSGGMLQRAMIAISIALQPKIIIADEPTTALDIITQFEIVKEFIRLREELHNTMIFISHDLGVVRKLADYVILMKNGEKVEEGETEDIFENPKSEYAKYLIGLRSELGNRYKTLMGEVCNA
ncbi:MAG: ABC transporter ATP-binding protein [Eubacteriales bacterium]